MNIFKSRPLIPLLVFASGMAALSWEVMWQIKSTLALGISAWGTAITLSVTMGGMCIGALCMGQILRNITVARPLRLYGVLECIIGLSGLFLSAAFKAVENIDTLVYATSPQNAPFVYMAGIITALGLPTLAMGATLPVLGLIGKQSQHSIARLYGLNTLGAATGTLLCAFLLIPCLGITGSVWTIAIIDIVIGIIAFTLPLPALSTSNDDEEIAATRVPSSLSSPVAITLVLTTGFATFMLEVAWFRSLTAAFMSTTDAFAIMLACVLLSLGGGAALVPLIRKNKKISLGTLLGWSGFCILVTTPIIERFDLFAYTVAEYPVIVFIQWFAITLYVIGLPMLLLGLALPWVLDEQKSPRQWGILYGLNAMAAILGSITAGWFLLPSIGFAATAWIAGTLVAMAGIAIAPQDKRKLLIAGSLCALVLAITFESGIGRTRVQGSRNFDSSNQPTKILEALNGPDSTVSATEYADGGRVLFIDGFETTMQADAGKMEGLMHYMAWMGHLPMMAHPDPQQALVICFGTGQTANAVRRENPSHLDIVDINKNILQLAPHFTANEGVLLDPRVKTTVMDGRAYMRRTSKKYDVITLEPMPPSFAGVNALYSQEFYQAARARMTESGMIAQWLPFHLLTPYYSAAIAKTFQSVFPNALLWVDPPSGTGILLGTLNSEMELGHPWPGLTRKNITRDLSSLVIDEAIALNKSELEKYAANGDIITDDNQLLSYGKAAYLLRAATARHENQESFKAVKSGNSQK